MSVQNVNERVISASPISDPTVAPSTDAVVDASNKVTFEKARSSMEEMLKMNFGVIQELLGQIVAVNPFRPDMAQGKQPDVAAAEASDEVNSAPVAPVGSSSAAAYIAGLKHLDSLLSGHNTKIQKVMDQLALSAPDRTSQPNSQGVEYEALLGVLRQAETRLQHLNHHMPASTPDSGEFNAQEWAPEFIRELLPYASLTHHIQMSLRSEIASAEQGTTGIQ